MSCIFTLTETRSEISCMIYLEDSNVLVTEMKMVVEMVESSGHIV